MVTLIIELWWEKTEKDGCFSHSLPFPIDSLSAAIFYFCSQAKIAWRGL